MMDLSIIWFAYLNEPANFTDRLTVTYVNRVANQIAPEQGLQTYKLWRLSYLLSWSTMENLPAPSLLLAHSAFSSSTSFFYLLECKIKVCIRFIVSEGWLPNSLKWHGAQGEIIRP